mmetsp:Transcript_2447/g.5606  ORF Transcript_2447/g.5606 Transcript_2447/m.5606 type:complete len:421 (-) Transcript_2447:200-1462(-)|eukprot:CAMPEP_0171500018 /NCGR_PEP_ID=MMETSP0958-20121227/8747_1 /TAXON_ID=87120 /ORGANISM="Aurantiochytrium limacinum, Strain ATCCMYA-1381" /LENGTH=420 /DNA_ID=CAMNT_0012034631 /DNA_START=311 /DNA_END=1573 /DNA_ORIENTATION=+
MLPTHTKSRNGGAPTALKLQSAFDKGMHMAGIKSTKSGSGDKEKAYIIRQNWALKTVLLILVVFGIGIVILFNTVLQVNISRREAMKAEKVHHQLEHQAQVRLMKAHLELQKALETEIHETSRFEEFRSIAEYALGDYSASVIKLLHEKNIDKEVIQSVETSTDTLRKNLDTSFDNVLHHFKGVAENARRNLKRVAHAIVSDVELDKKEEDRFREKMQKKFGVDVSHDDPKKADQQAHSYDQYGVLDESDQNEDIDEDDEEIQDSLEYFFKKLKAHDYPLLNADVIEEWENDMQTISATLADEEKEVDLNSIRDRVTAKIAMHAPNVEKFDPSKHNSIVDYYEMQIELAKISFHKQTLMDLYSGWKDDGGLSVYTILSGLEHIAEENNMYLLYEWLDDVEADEDEEPDAASKSDVKDTTK